MPHSIKSYSPDAWCKRLSENVVRPLEQQREKLSGKVRWGVDSKREIPLTGRAGGVLRRRLAKVKGDYLFPGRGVGDQPIVKVNNAHVGTIERSGVRRFRLYDLRHTWATRAAMAGVDLVTLAAMLRHS